MDDRQLAQPFDVYLLALADSIYQAQRQLNQLVVEAQPGQPTVSYQLPRVDFEFKVSFSLEERRQSESGRPANQLAITPVDGTNVRSSSASMVSTIKGAFVSVPATGGKPAPALATTVQRSSSKSGSPFTLTARAYAVSGENLPGVEIQFNINRQLSKQLSVAAGAGDGALKPGTTIDYGVRTTNANGIAQVLLTFDDAEPAGACVAVQVNGLGIEEVVVFSVPEAPKAKEVGT